jgi:hypothetical protein
MTAGRSHHQRRSVADTDDAPFDPTTFHADVIPDVDATAGPHKCNCAASDDNPY